MNNRVSKIDTMTKKTRDTVQDYLRSAISAQHPIILPLVDIVGDDQHGDMEIVLQSLVEVSERGRGNESAGTLPNRIRFPYSRHSSYRELCHLVSVLKPRDIWPCTVDPLRWMREGEYFIYGKSRHPLELTPGTGLTIAGLFGEYCTGYKFDHDGQMAELAAFLKVEEQHVSQATSDSNRQSSSLLEQSSPIPTNVTDKTSLYPQRNYRGYTTIASVQSGIRGSEIRPQESDTAGQQQQVTDLTLEHSDTEHGTGMQRKHISNKRSFGDFNEDDPSQLDIPEKLASGHESANEDDSHLFDSQDSSISARALETRQIAFDAMIESSNPTTWGGLLSTTNNHTHDDFELGGG